MLGDPVTRYNKIKLTGKRLHTKREIYFFTMKIIVYCNKQPANVIYAKTIKIFRRTGPCLPAAHSDPGQGRLGGGGGWGG